MKWTYPFNQSDEVEEGMRNTKSKYQLLGRKGASLVEMTREGLPVPSGFIVIADAGILSSTNGMTMPEDLWDQMLEAIHEIEKASGKKFGDPTHPLLLSIRLSPSFSIPSRNRPLLNLGINDEIVQGLVALTGDERFAYDSYRRFIRLFSNMSFKFEIQEFDHLLEQYKTRAGVLSDTDIPIDDLKTLVFEFKNIFENHSGMSLPSDVFQQLRQTIEALFSSWNNEHINDYRNSNRVAVIIQNMVFGNLGNDSGTGFTATRNPRTGEKQLHGEYLLNAQYEDLLTATRMCSKIDRLEHDLPGLYHQLQEIANCLERYYCDVQVVDFVVEQGKLWVLDSHPAQRSARANLRFSLDLLDEGIISEKQAVLLVQPDHLQQLLASNLL